MRFVNVKYRIYLTFRKRICDTSLRTLALCLGSGYSKRTINNAYAFLICTSEVRFLFPKWHKNVEPTLCERPNNIFVKLLELDKLKDSIHLHLKIFDPLRIYPFLK